MNQSRCLFLGHVLQWHSATSIWHCEDVEHNFLKSFEHMINGTCENFPQFSLQVICNIVAFYGMRWHPSPYKIFLSWGAGQNIYLRLFHLTLPKLSESSSKKVKEEEKTSLNIFLESCLDLSGRLHTSFRWKAFLNQSNHPEHTMPWLWIKTLKVCTFPLLMHLTCQSNIFQEKCHTFT